MHVARRRGERGELPCATARRFIGAAHDLGCVEDKSAGRPERVEPLCQRAFVEIGRRAQPSACLAQHHLQIAPQDVGSMRGAIEQRGAILDQARFAKSDRRGQRLLGTKACRGREENQAERDEKLEGDEDVREAEK